jgi:hypothetical protein
MLTVVADAASIRADASSVSYIFLTACPADRVRVRKTHEISKFTSEEVGKDKTLTTATLDDALALVVAKFHGVTDKAGQPYVLHCLRVMLGVSGSLARQVAVMHDLVEDTDVTLNDLRTLAFAEEVIAGVELVTHFGTDSYADYVVRLKANELARQAKIADLHDNYSLGRVAYRDQHNSQDANRIQRYILSYQFLMDVINESSYRRQMASLQ